YRKNCRGIGIIRRGCAIGCSRGFIEGFRYTLHLLTSLLRGPPSYSGGARVLASPRDAGKHHRNRHPVPEWVHRQVYLNPYPKELMLRKHV
ncbi:MAG: hypothetical protein JXA42_00220, partial [Anaerolineales bacterium]|nr:hypothetical protein [Anaerolineales bacterium]